MCSRNDCVVTRRDELRRIWPDGVFGESRAQGRKFRPGGTGGRDRRRWRQRRSRNGKPVRWARKLVTACSFRGRQVSRRRERWRKSPHFMRLFDDRSTRFGGRKQAADEAAPNSVTFGWRGKPDATGASPRRTEAQRAERKPEVLGRQNATQVAGAARQKPERPKNGRREPQRSFGKRPTATLSRKAVRSGWPARPVGSKGESRWITYRPRDCRVEGASPMKLGGPIRSSRERRVKRAALSGRLAKSGGRLQPGRAPGEHAAMRVQRKACGNAGGRSG